METGAYFQAFKQHFEKNRCEQRTHSGFGHKCLGDWPKSP
jgi:hypothetical protein